MTRRQQVTFVLALSKRSHTPAASDARRVPATHWPRPLQPVELAPREGEACSTDTATLQRILTALRQSLREDQETALPVAPDTMRQTAACVLQGGLAALDEQGLHDLVLTLRGYVMLLVPQAEQYLDPGRATVKVTLREAQRRLSDGVIGRRSAIRLAAVCRNLLDLLEPSSWLKAAS